MSKIFGKQLPVSPTNYAVNGNMDYWQRGTTFNAAASNTYTADRFWQASTQTATINVTRQSINALSIGSQYALRIERSTGATLGNWGIGQSLEAIDFNRLKGKTVTLSCLLRKGPAYTGNLAIKVATRTTESRSALVSTNDVEVAVATILNVSLSTTAFIQARVTLSIPAGSTATSLELQIYDPSTQAGASNAYFEVAQVMLNEGSIANPSFVYNSGNISAELLKCQRYYEKSYNLSVPPGTTGSQQGAYMTREYSTGDTFRHELFFKAQKRAAGIAPVVYNVETGATGSAGLEGAGGSSAVGTATTFQGDYQSLIYGTVNAIGNHYFHWVVDAEL